MSCAEISPQFLDAVIRGDHRSWMRFADLSAGIVRTSVNHTLTKYLADACAQDVHDIVQDVYLRLLKDGCRLLRSYDPARSSLRTWLAVIARSVAVDHLRKRRRAGCAVSPEVLEQMPAPEHPDLSPCFPDPLLSERQNQVMHMLFDRDFGVRETARKLGVQEQTVRSVRHQSLRKLRTRYVGQGCA